MYVTEDYNRYFNLDFPAPVKETRLHESASSDLLIQLEDQIAAEKDELAELEKQYDAAYSKYRDEFLSDPEYQKLEKELDALSSELASLEMSCRIHNPYDREGHDWELDIERYEEVKDRIAELEDKVISSHSARWKPYNDAKAKADSEFQYTAKSKAHKDRLDTRAKTFQALIAEETPEIERIVAKLNSDCEASCSPQFKADFRGATFKNGVLRIPLVSGRTFETIYEIFEPDDFIVDDRGLEPEDYSFDEDRYWELYLVDEVEIHHDLIAEECGYQEEAAGYRIDTTSDWLLAKNTQPTFIEVPEVVEVDVYDGEIDETITDGDIKYEVVCWLYKAFR